MRDAQYIEDTYEEIDDKKKTLRIGVVGVVGEETKILYGKPEFIGSKLMGVSLTHESGFGSTELAKALEARPILPEKDKPEGLKLTNLLDGTDLSLGSERDEEEAEDRVFLKGKFTEEQIEKWKEMPKIADADIGLGEEKKNIFDWNFISTLIFIALLGSYFIASILNHIFKWW